MIADNHIIYLEERPIGPLFFFFKKMEKNDKLYSFYP